MKNKFKKISIIGGLILAIIIIVFAIKNAIDIRNNYDYYIKYKDNTNIYDVYKKKNKIRVYAEEQPICIKAPCSKIKTKYSIKFSDANMNIVNNFINSLFIYEKEKSIQLSDEDLNSEQYNIMKSIVNNNETLLKDIYDFENYQYTIITDSQYKTLQNDGGSNYNVYYEINFENNVIKKYEDHYIGFKGYEYQGKLIYEKSINENTVNDLKVLLIDLLVKEDINDTKNYSPYTIKSNNIEKEIYNEKSIKSLKKLLNKIDSIK